MPSLRPIEIFLIELVIYLLLWLADDYFATLISVIMAGIFLAGLLISLAVEAVERSKVPREYFYFMIASILAPLLAAGIFLLLNGEPEWLR